MCQLREENRLKCLQKGEVVLILAARKRADPEAFRNTHARIAQLVEHNLAKVGVASSNLVSRSSKASHFGGLFSLAWQGFPRVGNLVEDQEEKAYALTLKAYIPMVGVEAHF